MKKEKVLSKDDRTTHALALSDDVSRVQNEINELTQCACGCLCERTTQTQSQDISCATEARIACIYKRTTLRNNQNTSLTINQ